MKENERNDYGLVNPDGRIANVFESKNTSINDTKGFTKENNVSEVNEQEQVKEQTVTKTGLREKSAKPMTTNLVSVSGYFATTAVAVAGAVVVAAYVVAASIGMAVAELFAITNDSLTFYVQCYLNDENSYIARLYSEEQTIEEFEVTKPFLEFYELNPDTAYTLEIVNAESKETVFQKEFKTAAEDVYGVEFESWIEENTLMIYPYVNEDFPIPEEVTTYTISIFDQKGNSIYKNTFETLEEEYVIELPEGTFTNPKTQGAGTGGSSTSDPSTGDETVSEEMEQIIYVAILYNLNGIPIGKIQQVSNQGW